jgi:hypothetical protein
MHRRHFLAGLAGVGAAISIGGMAHASGEVIDIDWPDLAPEDDGSTMERLRALGVVEHGELSTPFDQDLGGRVTHAYDGKRVRIPGFLVPLDFSGAGVTDFLLVPYVGACIHVPPPPPNQLVLVALDAPYVADGLFEAVYVTGTMATTAATTEFAEVGYTITEGEITPYEF